jgi:chemotaxis protein methyltransferase CheR
VGTDCRLTALVRARQGVYDAPSLREVPGTWLDQYFKFEQGRWRVIDSLRRAASWRGGDATREVEPGPWDLILCRNLAMYLRSPVASRLWQTLEASLRPGGFLVLGKAERPLGAQNLRLVAPCIFLKA